jgi:serine protease Do
MNLNKRILITLSILPALLLASCSGMSIPLSLAPVQAAAPAAVATLPQAPAANLSQAAPTAVAQANPLPAANSPEAASAPAPAASNNVKTAASKLPATSALVNPAVDLQAFQADLEAVYKAVNPSVVSIQVLEQSAPTTNFRGRTVPGSGTAMALGSGWVWDTQGHIVTNNHVVSGATSITVTFADGASYDASVVGTDPNADLAVIKVNGAPASELVPVHLADSTQVQVGEIAIAIGNPFGLSNTMTQGIISALARTLPVGLDSQTAQTGPTYNIPDIIQTDASINPGNSGGVLVDMQGQVIGIPSAIESQSNSSSGVGFVIPSEIVSKVIPVLIEKGSYDHPYLGVTGTNLDLAINTAMGLPKNQQGALIIDVTPGGPAGNAGVRGGSKTVTVDGQDMPIGGDIITAINGQAMSSFDAVGSYLFLHTQPGEKVTLTILRGGKTLTVPVTVGTLPAQ